MSPATGGRAGATGRLVHHFRDAGDALHGLRVRAELRWRLDRERARYEDGGVFPAGLIDSLIKKVDRPIEEQETRLHLRIRF